MKLTSTARRTLITAVVAVLLMAGFGTMTGCKTVEEDRGGGHRDFHEDHHDDRHY